MFTCWSSVCTLAVHVGCVSRAQCVFAQAAASSCCNGNPTNTLRIYVMVLGIAAVQCIVTCRLDVYACVCLIVPIASSAQLCIYLIKSAWRAETVGSNLIFRTRVSIVYAFVAMPLFASHTCCERARRAALIHGILRGIVTSTSRCTLQQSLDGMFATALSAGRVYR